MMLNGKINSAYDEHKRSKVFGIVSLSSPSQLMWQASQMRHACQSLPGQVMSVAKAKCEFAVKHIMALLKNRRGERHPMSTNTLTLVTSIFTCATVTVCLTTHPWKKRAGKQYKKKGILKKNYQSKIATCSSQVTFSI
jgi:hypothetical protein